MVNFSPEIQADWFSAFLRAFLLDNGLVEALLIFLEMAVFLYWVKGNSRKNKMRKLAKKVIRSEIIKLMKYD